MSAHIAIVGSGQLAQMMAQDGIPMGLSFSFVAEEKEDTVCVDSLGKVVVRRESMSAEELFNALGKPDVITVEKEHVDIDLLKALQVFCPVHPNPDALEKFKNRRVEKEFLQSLNIPIAPYKVVRTEDDVQNALRVLEKPVFIKTEEEGYDGYNQFKVTEENQGDVLKAIEYPGQWVAEQGVPFDREISFIAARTESGEMEFYPPAENYHHLGTLLTSIAPAKEVSEAMQKTGQSYLQSMMDHLDYVGVMCVECFAWGEKLLVNEIAPRVHNSGHWTSKGALTSQFENHVRAVAKLSLGSAKTSNISGMLNLLGVVLTAEDACDEKTFLKLYGKSIRPRRKLGHVTVVVNDYDEAQARLESLRKLAYKA